MQLHSDDRLLTSICWKNKIDTRKITTIWIYIQVDDNNNMQKDLRIERSFKSTFARDNDDRSSLAVVEAVLADTPMDHTAEEILSA